MKRMFPIVGTLLALSGCISTPDTKVLVTPLGAAGYHTFAPEDSPDRLRAARLESLTEEHPREAR